MTSNSGTSSLRAIEHGIDRGSGRGRGHNVSMRVVVTLKCVRVSPIPLLVFVEDGGGELDMVM